MEWRDAGIVLGLRRHGENAVVLEIMTRAHGRHLGVVRNGRSRTMQPVLQPGNHVDALWRARLEDQLGWFACEPLEATAMAFLDDAGRLEAMTAALELLDATLPERQPHPELHAATRAFLGALGDAPAPAALLARWEVGVLAALGFGLDLTRCAATGAADDLAYVSPRSGRAVSRAGAGTLADRLLGLPAFLLDPRSPAEAADIAAALALTGHFVARHLLAPAGRSMPPARLRVVDRLARAARLRGP